MKWLIKGCSAYSYQFVIYTFLIYFFFIKKEIIIRLIFVLFCGIWYFVRKKLEKINVTTHKHEISELKKINFASLNAIINMKEHITKMIASRIVFEIKFIINDKISEDILIDLSNYI